VEERRGAGGRTESGLLAVNLQLLGAMVVNPATYPSHNRGREAWCRGDQERALLGRKGHPVTRKVNSELRKVNSELRKVISKLRKVSSKLRKVSSELRKVSSELRRVSC
jgi:hypothetical protein